MSSLSMVLGLAVIWATQVDQGRREKLETERMVALAADLLKADGWELKPIEGSSVKPSERGEAYCDAKSVSERKRTVGSSESDCLMIHSVGKGSHHCDAPTQVSKVIEIPATCRVQFMLANSHAWGDPPQVMLRVTDPDGQRTLFGPQSVATGTDDVDVSCMREVLFMTEKAVRVRLVLETTCRTWISISGVVVEPCAPKAPTPEAWDRVTALLKELTAEEIAARDAAQARIQEEVCPPERQPSTAASRLAARAGWYGALTDELRRQNDPEVRARLQVVLREAGRGIADLRAFKPALVR